MTDTGSTRFRAIIAPIDAITTAGAWLAGLCLLGIVVMITSEVVSRNFLGSSLPFSWEYAAYLMGATFMLASAGALKGGAHVRVSAVLELVPTPVARLLEIAAVIVGGAACLALAWALGEMAWLSLQRGSTSSTVMRTPLFWPQALSALGAGLLVLQCVAQLCRLARGERLTVGAALE